MHGIFLLDREPSDTTIGNPVNATDKTVELSDRDGNSYVGLLVCFAETWNEATRYVQNGYESGYVNGRLVDNDRVTGKRHEVPKHGLVILDMAKHPRAGSPLKFA